MRALAFEHLRPNTIGVYGDVLDGRGIEVDRVMVDDGEAIPDWRDYDFLIVMGAAAILVIETLAVCRAAAAHAVAAVAGHFVPYLAERLKRQIAE